MRLSFTLLLWAFTTAFLTAQRTTSADLEKAANDITVSPPDREISKEKRLIVNFPAAMIPLETIGIADQISPITFTPALTGEGHWISTTAAMFTVASPVKPGQTYTLTLRDNLTTATGESLSVPSWKPIEFKANLMEVSSRFQDQGTALSASPEVDLRVNYPVTPADVIQTVYFQDREARQRLASAIVLPQANARTEDEPVPQPTEVTQFLVTPAEPLPVGKIYDLIIEGLPDAGTRTPLPDLKAIALGSAQALQITHVEVYTHPLDKPAVVLETSGPVDHETLNTNSVIVEPAVPNLTFFADENAVRLKGDFDTGRTYRISFGDSVKSKTGYALAQPGPHEAVFHGLSPIIVFPQAQFFQRSALGLHVTVLQSNCPEANWRLARIPLEKLKVVQDRLKEFEKDAEDPFTGNSVGAYQTELLTDALSLQVAANGSIPSAGKNEALYREIRWKPETGGVPPGAYLLETSATLEDGRVVGNRSILFFNEVVIQHKLTSESVEIKVFTMESSQPLANAQVEIIDANNIPLASGVTDATGGLTLSRTLTEPGKHSKASYIVVQSETKNGGGIQPYQGARFISSGWVGRSSARSGNAPVVTASAFADRSLYRPGDPVHVKGTVRLQDESRLLIPSGDVSWNVIQGYSGPTLASGDSSIDAFGGWEMTWTPPKTAKLGSYNVRYTVPPSKSSDSVHFQIEEYKPPLFVVELDDPTQQKMRIASHYFHGSPNAGAMVRWEASWSPNTSREDGSQASDQYSPNHKKTLSQLQRKGEFRLDADGVGFIDLEVPFEKPWSSGCYLAYISVEVLSPEGQVMEAAKYATITPHKVIPTIAWKRVADDEPGSKELQVDLRTEDVNGTKLTELPMSLTIYRKETQTVKERLGQNVYRYRNFPLFHTIKSEDVLSGSNYRFTPEGTGHFVAYAKLKDMPTAPAVSDSIHSVGDGEGRYDVYNDGEITLQLDKKRYVAGKDTAQIALESPFGGQAWVCVETDRIIDQFLIDLPANNRTISLPIKPSYHPNVHASVYLLRPGGPDHLPSERYGMVDIEVDRPDLELSVTPELITSEVDPGGDVSGIVRVLCQGQPVLNADVTVFAVDEAVHQLGHWEMPEWYADVYPRRYLGVASYRGLDEHFEKFEEREVTEKGFLIGGGAEAFAASDSGGNGPKTFRKDFVALAFWKTQLRTNEKGEVAFDFKAPDNLTSFHVVAVSQTQAHQFGEGETTFKVAKRLMVEPALTRFVRKGDTLELRAVVRQNYLDSAAVIVTCTVEGEIEWLSEGQEQRLALTKGLPQVVRFPCRVLGGDAVQVRFQAQGEGDITLQDAVEVTLPVALPGIVQHTGHFGVIPKKKATFPIHETLPEHWAGSTGSYRMTVSHTPFLPELNSLPEVLDYPHGCWEQKGARFLSYALMTDLLAYLPELQGRHGNYKERLEQGIAEADAALLDSGFMPYWDGHDKPYDWVTLMTYWWVQMAKQQGVDVPERFDLKLSQAHAMLASGQRRTYPVDLTSRAFALFTHAETGHPVEGMEALLTDLYARRGDLPTDALTLLTLTMNRYGVMEKEQRQLGKVLENEAKQGKVEFDPVTFGSPQRDVALRWLTRVRLASMKERRQLSQAFLKENEDAGNATLSTQEHFWKALLLKDLVQLDKDNAFAKPIQPKPDFNSTNNVSVAWKSQPLERLRDLALELGSGKSDRYYAISADVVRDSKATPMEDRGFRLERVVTNLTDKKRLGTEDAPFQMGDELLLTYQFEAKKRHHYVALTDELPAGIEVVNFDLPQIAAVYRLPDSVKPTLHLSHSELRDQSANLYFNTVSASHHTYAILARVTGSGDFIWPSTQIQPMYQPYFGGLTAGRVAHSQQGP